MNNLETIVTFYGYGYIILGGLIFENYAEFILNDTTIKKYIYPILCGPLACLFFISRLLTNFIFGF